MNQGIGIGVEFGSARPSGQPDPWGLGAAPRRTPSALHVPMRTPAEPPAGLGPPIEPDPTGLGLSRAAELPRLWWAFALVGVVVLGALGLGAWALLAGGARAGEVLDDGTRQVSAHGLRYPVPNSWRSTTPGTPRWPFGIQPEGVATAPAFDCAGENHARATAGVLRVYRKDGRPTRIEDASAQFGPELAATFYGPAATAQSSAPTPLQVDGLTGSTTLVTVRGGGCELQGQITVVALPSELPGPNGEPTVRLLVVQRDTAGGPKTPGRLKERAVTELLGGLRVTHGS